MIARARPRTPGRQPLGLGVVVGPEQVDEGGHEHRRQRAGGDELEEDVGDRARGLVGVAEVGGAEHRGDHPDLDEPDPAARPGWRCSCAPQPASLIARHHGEPAYGGARVFRRRRACWREVAHPTAVDPCLGGWADRRRVGAPRVRGCREGLSSLALHDRSPAGGRTCAARRTPTADPRRGARGRRAPARRAARPRGARAPGAPRVLRTRGRAREPHQRQVRRVPGGLRVLLAVGALPHRRRRLPVPRPRRGARSARTRHARRRRHPVLHRRRGARARGAAARPR